MRSHTASVSLTHMDKTIAQILTEVRVEKTCSMIQLRRYLSRINIKPIGARQRPQRYPADTTERIFIYLGIAPIKLPSVVVTAPAGRPPRGSSLDKSTRPKRTPKGPKLLTMEQLRAERENANHGRGSK